MILVLLLAGCRPPTVLDLEPDVDRSGQAGEDGPFGAAHGSFRAQARVTDVVRYEISWPAGEDGGYAEAADPCPLVTFVHGGLVAPEGYRWLATHLATRGYCVVSPEHDLQLAILESDNASIALTDVLERPPEVLDGHLGAEAVILGHSLGGAVGSFRWVADERFVGLGLLASWPSEGTDVESQGGRPSLSLIGSEDRDGEAVETAYEVYQRFPEPSWFGVIDGMSHYDWADGASDAELAGDGVPTRPRSDTRRDAQHVVDTWLDAWLRDDAAARDALDAHAFPNVEETP